MEKRTNLVRAAMTLLLAMLFPFWGTVGLLWADNVTASQARQQAQAFLNSRIAAGNGPRHAPGTTPQLMQEQMVSGLYVFNVNNDGGFVIVSNDDVAVPILGYSDSGTLDPDNMPDNMRAWLQGYADEIAWAKEHHIAKVDASSTPRINRALKAPIGPLLNTTWNQDEPYNNYTPYYGVSNGIYVYSTTGGTGYSHCATGCVATAMAQVMKYHKWPTEATAEIPSYKWKNKGSNLSKLTPTTFNWGKMLNSYDGIYEQDEADAVATLMKYCGYSVQMNYGKESSSNTDMVASALKAYFDYNSETTKFVSRSFYTYANWIELIYHELANDRPVVYGGQSSGGGHEFVCDGYQGEDYFHINWGWGGTSDDYFKLSALNPYTQGIGGSSSNDGFHYGQDAVIGIQPSTGTGTIANVTTTPPSLIANSMSLSSESIATGETVEITLNIKNNGEAEYEGDIYVGRRNGDNYSLLEGDVFLIAAGETKDCVIPFTPRSTGNYKLVVFYPNNEGSYSTNGTVMAELMVTPGETNPTTDNITLDCSLTVENSEVIQDNTYNVYGSIFKGTLTVTNPDNDYDYSGGFQYDIWINDGSSWDAVRKAQWVTIPANGSISIPIEYNGMTVGYMYEIDIHYYQNGVWGVEDILAYYWCKPAVTIYAADGTHSVSPISGQNFNAKTVAPEALVIDVSGTDITSITPNEQSNTLYIYSGTKPSGLNGKNVVKNENGSYTADNITLTDDNDFYSPVDITASNIVFNYKFTIGADGSKGWNTIMLPFNVTSVTANDTEIDWFHNKDDKGKNFWLKEFVNDEANKVYFNFANEMNANTPYIVAFPGNKWGEDWDMSNKDIKFIGSGAISKSGTMTSVTASNFRFIGNTVQDNTQNIYCLNDDGNAFVLKETGGSGPFRAYFKPGIFDRTLTSLAISSGTGTTTDIDAMFMNNAPSATSVYDLQGRRVTHPTKGLYIVNGKKVIVK